LETSSRRRNWDNVTVISSAFFVASPTSVALTSQHLRGWRDALLRYGGTGILVTQWIPCRPKNRVRLLKAIRELGPLCAGG